MVNSSRSARRAAPAASRNQPTKVTAMKKASPIQKASAMKLMKKSSAMKLAMKSAMKQAPPMKSAMKRPMKSGMKQAPPMKSAMKRPMKSAMKQAPPMKSAMKRPMKSAMKQVPPMKSAMKKTSSMKSAEKMAVVKSGKNPSAKVAATPRLPQALVTNGVPVKAVATRAQFNILQGLKKRSTHHNKPILLLASPPPLPQKPSNNGPQLSGKASEISCKNSASVSAEFHRSASITPPRAPRKPSTPMSKSRGKSTPVQHHVILEMFGWLDDHILMRDFSGAANVYFDNKLTNQCRKEIKRDLSDELLKHILSVAHRFIDVRWVNVPNDDDKKLCFLRHSTHLSNKERLAAVEKELARYSGEIANSAETKLKRPSLLLSLSCPDYATNNPVDGQLPSEIAWVGPKATPYTNARRRMERAIANDDRRAATEKFEEKMIALNDRRRELTDQLFIARVINDQQSLAVSKGPRTLDVFIRDVHKAAKGCSLLEEDVRNAVHAFLKLFPHWIKVKEFVDYAGASQIVRVDFSISVWTILPVLEKMRDALGKHSMNPPVPSFTFTQ